MAYQTIFFDLDGTLIDPKIAITSSVQYALSKFDIESDVNELLPFIGPPLNKSFSKYYGFSDRHAMLAVEYYREFFSKEGVSKITVYDGIKEMLKSLKARNKTLFIVSSKSTEGATETAKHVGLDIYFDTILGARIDLSNADKPALVKEALLLTNGHPKNNVVMIGDREHDIFGAQANKIDSIAVAYGYGSIEELENSRPTHIAKTIDELEQFL